MELLQTKNIYVRRDLILNVNRQMNSCRVEVLLC